MDPPAVVRGVEHIPKDGRLVIVANHYQRRGLWIAWPGAVVTSAVADRRGDDPPLHWVVTGGLRLCQWKRRGPEIPFTDMIFQRVARTYQMAALPLTGKRKRARALKQWARWATRGEAVGLFPEGLSGGTDTLRPPEAGFEKLCRMLALIGCVFLPCGIYEEDAVLTVRFGEPVDPRSVLHADDGRRGDIVMEAIATLLPLPLRGPYGR
jgi:1-acyl-sn-glycerol-3-phosphate acyltransferase